jgi:hypothetical protein
MSSGATSLERAAAAVIDSGAESGAAILGVVSDATQLDLLRDEHGKLGSNVFRLARQEPEKARKVGRPKDARNKRSDGLAKLIAHKYGDPVEFQAAIYHMPLDQLCELLLIADGTRERAEKLDEMLGGLSDRIRELAAQAKAQRNIDGMEAIERLAEACEALESVTRRGAGKPGDVALKALNLQLAAARAVSEYVHSKKPVEVKHDLGADMVLVMPAAGQRAGFDEIDAATRQASDIIARALTSGEITPELLAGVTLRDGQLVEAEYTEIDDADGAGE